MISGSVGVVGDYDGSLPSVTGSFQNQQRKKGIAALLDVSNQRFQGHLNEESL